MPTTYTAIIAEGTTISVAEITDGTPGTAVLINGVTEYVLAQEVKDADVTTFTSYGNAEHLRTINARTIKVIGEYYEASSGGRDAGQATLQDLADSFGDEAYGQFVITLPDLTTRTFKATATMDKLGGTVDTSIKWEATLKVSGGITYGTSG